MTPHPKSKFVIAASHGAFGNVKFIYEAEDAKAAFSMFKQTVYSIRQWIIISNAEMKENQSEEVTA